MTIISRRDFVDATFSCAILSNLGIHCSPARANSESVSVLDFRLPMDADDTAAFQRAVATGRPVYAPASAGLGPGGVYLVNEVRLIAGVELFGDGIGRTILRPGGNEAVFHCDSGSATMQIVGIRISNLTLEGWVVKHGFAEHRHLLHLNGVKDVLIEHTEFKGFQGDGLYLGSSRQVGITRHNRGIIIRKCVFDGVNNNNRNAISVIDGEQILIEDCIFKNCTRANMPGAIDFEPDETKEARIRDIIIWRCQFINIGGNIGVIAFHIPPQVIAIPRRISITENKFENYRGTGGEIYFNLNRSLWDESPSMDVVINGNHGSGGQWIYTFYSAKGISAVGNKWENYKQGAMIGYTAPNQQASNVKLSDQFVECGKVSGVGIYIFNVSMLVIQACRLIDCGNGSKTSYGICFSRGKSEFVALTSLQVRAPSRKTYVAVIRDQLHELAPSTNVQHSNDFGGLPAIDISKPV